MSPRVRCFPLFLGFEEFSLCRQPGGAEQGTFRVTRHAARLLKSEDGGEKVKKKTRVGIESDEAKKKRYRRKRQIMQIAKGQKRILETEETPESWRSKVSKRQKRI
jgi:hypothetical protein